MNNLTPRKPEDELRAKWFDDRDARCEEEFKKIPRKPEEIAYLAGLFDGEGCIMVSRNHRLRYKTSVANLSAKLYSVKLCIHMTDEKILRWIHGQFPGTKFNKRKNDNPKWKDSFVVEFPESWAIPFLRMLYPYMRVKKEQAAMFFKFVETKKQNRYRADSHRAALLDKLYWKVKSYNARGKKIVPLPEKHQGSVETERCAPINDGVKFQSEPTGDCRSSELVTA